MGMERPKALEQMQAELKKDKAMREDLKNNPFYEEWTAEGRVKGKLEGMIEAIIEGRIQDALTLMRKMGISAEAAADLLDFTETERVVLLQYIQSQNGNGTA
jgi:predicted transposase YdaD